MNFNVIPTNKFKKEAKRLSKKFPSLKADLKDLGLRLQQDPKLGTSLGSNLY